MSTVFNTVVINPTAAVSQVSFDLRGVYIRGILYDIARGGIPVPFVNAAKALLVNNQPDASTWNQRPYYNRYNCDDQAWIQVKPRPKGVWWLFGCCVSWRCVPGRAA